MKIHENSSEKNSLNEKKTIIDFRKSTPIPFNKNSLKIDEKNLKSSLSIESFKKLKLDEFDEDKFAYPREYNEDTKKYGKKFFQYRYLKGNTKEKDKDDLRRNNYFFLIVLEKSIFYYLLLWINAKEFYFLLFLY